jgi:hypothetical protein
MKHGLETVDPGVKTTSRKPDGGGAKSAILAVPD